MKRALAPLILLTLCLPAAGESLRLTVTQALPGGSAHGQPTLNITLSPKSAEKLAHFTETRIGQTVEMVVDDTVVMTPYLRDAITGGQFQITGTPADAAQANALITRLNRGEAVLELRDPQD